MKEASLDLGDTRQIINECKSRDVLRNQAAYILATAYWETARTMKPVREMGGEKYLRKKRYYPYVGMGYVQLTWKTNYEKASKVLGVDFVKKPRLLLDPIYAKKILVEGMIEGWFTGKKLSDYITLQKSDFVGARRIINGVDRRYEIAKIAREYDKALLLEGYGVSKPEKPVFETVKNDNPLKNSRTLKGGVTTTGGGAAVMVEPIKELVDVIQGQQDNLTAGNWIMFAIGAAVVMGGLVTIYARWDDAGRPSFKQMLGLS